MRREIPTSELQTLPAIISKKKLVEIYLRSGIPEDITRSGINQIIIDNRINQDTFKPASAKGLRVAVKIVRKEELDRFIQIYGMPVGYTR